MSAASRRKGSGFEREVAKALTVLGVPAKRTPLSGALADWPGDIILPGYVVECKRVERLNIWAALLQVLAAARGCMEPLLIFRRNAKPNEKPQTWVAMRLEHFAAMVNELDRHREMVAQ